LYLLYAFERIAIENYAYNKPKKSNYVDKPFDKKLVQCILGSSLKIKTVGGKRLPF